jgi:hypothetical protein
MPVSLVLLEAGILTNTFITSCRKRQREPQPASLSDLPGWQFARAAYRPTSGLRPPDIEVLDKLPDPTSSARSSSFPAISAPRSTSPTSKATAARRSPTSWEPRSGQSRHGSTGPAASCVAFSLHRAGAARSNWPAHEPPRDTTGHRVRRADELISWTRRDRLRFSRQCEATVAIVEDRGFLARLEAVQSHLPQLRRVVLIDGGPGPSEDWLIAWDAVVALGRTAAGRSPGPFVATWRGVGPEDLAALIYTSGTTRPPNGVMITHHNVRYCAAAPVAGAAARRGRRRGRAAGDLLPADGPRHRQDPGASPEPGMVVDDDHAAPHSADSGIRSHRSHRG